MGDTFRRLLSRTLAQQASDAFMAVCAPFQYALSTRAGTEALAWALAVSAELRPQTTVVSVDGVGAYDHVARAAMFEGLRRDARLAALIPFVRQFYVGDSAYVFYDSAGHAHEVAQAEGGEQGDPLMPGLFAVAWRWPSTRHRWQPMTTCDPGRTCMPFWTTRMCPVSQTGRARPSARYANIDVHLGKTRVWNAAGIEPPGLRELLPTAPGMRRCGSGTGSCRQRHKVSWSLACRWEATSTKWRPLANGCVATRASSTSSQACQNSPLLSDVLADSSEPSPAACRSLVCCRGVGRLHWDRDNLQCPKGARKKKTNLSGSCY